MCERVCVCACVRVILLEEMRSETTHWNREKKQLHQSEQLCCVGLWEAWRGGSWIKVLAVGHLKG